MNSVYDPSDGPAPVPPIAPEPPVAHRSAAREPIAQAFEVAACLTAPGLTLEPPPLLELTAALVGLARGGHRKALVPLPRTPAEYALERRGDALLVSCYTTTNPPEVLELEHATDLAGLLSACARALEATTEGGSAPASGRVALAAEARIAPAASPVPVPVVRRGGALEAPRDEVPLAFGFDARIYPTAPGSPRSRSARADLHALLFSGRLWAFIRGRRVGLIEGPIVLAAQRMVALCGQLVDAARDRRALHVRSSVGGLRVALRLDEQGEVAVGFSNDAGLDVTVASLDVGSAARPLLRLAGDLMRALIAADRGQVRNLRVQALREEIRAIGRRLRDEPGQGSFVNDDPDRLRLRLAEAGRSSRPSLPLVGSRGPALRFEPRWNVAVDGLDTSAVFRSRACLVVSGAREVLALGRDRGDVLWARPRTGDVVLVDGSRVVTVRSSGEVELSELATGAPYARCRISPPAAGASVRALRVGGGALPPMAVLRDGAHRIVAIDLRTGELRWRFAPRAGGLLALRRASRVLLVVAGDGAVDALDVATGENLWRFTAPAAFVRAPTVVRETVVALATECDGASTCFGEEDECQRTRTTAYGIDLCSGRRLWERALDGPTFAGPIALDGAAALVTREASLAPATCLRAYDANTGAERWSVEDPGLAVGGAALAVDDALIVNAPSGVLTSLDAASGALRFRLALSDRFADEVPRHLDPILRGGALFVPGASVHVLRPADGTQLCASAPTDLLPDWLGVDERGWVYVAEDGGELCASAPAPRLTLIEGGR